MCSSDLDKAGNLTLNPTDYDFYVWPVTFPVGYWKLDETSGTTAADASGLNYPATFTGGASWTTGRVGGGAAFNGTDGSAGTSAPVLRTDASFTVGAWARLTTGSWGGYSATPGR